MWVFHTNISTILNSSTLNVTDTHCESTDLHRFPAMLWLKAAEVITAILGLPANAKVLWIILKNKADSSTSDIFTANLALMDILFCSMIALEILNTHFLNQPNISQGLYFFMGLSEIGGPFFLTCVCVDLYLAVLHPIAFMKFRDHKWRAVCSAVAWVFTVCYSTSLMIIQMDYMEVILSVIQFSILIVIVICNIYILRALKESGPGGQEVHPIKKRAYNTVLVNFLIIMISYIPAVLAFTLKSRFTNHVFSCYIIPFPLSFMCVSNCVQPFLYIYRVG
uniref:G-protein coupled receptors family 1 profile domain-containing protein n=1 Tax=Lepisosteus oculatus TaxID=7918 RepID=W5NLA4_LEPOC